MKCQTCGTEIGKNDQFCHNCGHKVSADLIEVNALNINPGEEEDKPIKSRFASVSPDEFDSSLEKWVGTLGVGALDIQNSDSKFLQSDFSDEERINNALEKESGHLLDNAENSSPKNLNNLKNDEKDGLEAPGIKTSKPESKKPNSMFLAMAGILILGFAIGALFLSGSGDLIPYVPLLQNSTNTTPDSTVQQTPQEVAPTQNNTPNEDSICSLCNGNGLITCSICGGSGFLGCSNCGGTGELGNGEQCLICGGFGRIICAECQATGKITCPECGGTGKSS